MSDQTAAREKIHSVLKCAAILESKRRIRNLDYAVAQCEKAYDEMTERLQKKQ